MGDSSKFQEKQSRREDDEETREPQILDAKPRGLWQQLDGRAPVQRQQARGMWNMVNDLVQRKESGEPSAADPGAVASAGVQSASERLPHHEQIQASFGRHDVSGIRAQTGGAAAEASRGLGASAYAVGDRVGFAQSPDLHTAAHEAAHVVQQRGGVQLKGGIDGGKGDPYEQHADAVADKVVRGESAEGLLGAPSSSQHASESTAGVQRTGAPTSTLRKLVGPELYLSELQRDIWPAIRAHLHAVPWPNPHPHLALHNDREFVERVMTSLQATVDLDLRPQFDEVLAPAKPGEVIEPYIKGKGRGWVPAVGVALGEMFQDAILSSLSRVGPRWVSIAEHEPDQKGRLDETAPLVRYDQIVKSAPIDRAVAFGLVGPGVSRAVGATTTKSLAETKPRPLKKVTLEWMGSKDRSLWNWVKVTSGSDATAEDVAAQLWRESQDKYGEPTSFFAYGLTAAPPMFGLPASWARGFKDARDYAPAEDAAGHDSNSTRAFALAQSKTGDELALQQGAAAPAGAAPKATELIVTVDDELLQAQFLYEELLPWGRAEGARVLLAWLQRKKHDVATMRPEALGTWGPILTGQKDRLKRIGIGVRQVSGAAAAIGVGGPSSTNAAPLLELLDTYGRAAAVSHLENTCEDLLQEAARQQQGLALRGVRNTANVMTATTDAARDSLADGDRKRLMKDAADVSGNALTIQNKLAAGGEVDESEIDEVTLRAREITFDAKTLALLHQAAELKSAADEAGKGLASHIAAHFHGKFKSLQTALDTIRGEVGFIVGEWHAEVDEFDQHDNDPENRERRKREFRHDRLDRAEVAFDKFRRNTDSIGFLKEGADIIGWQRFAKACVEMLALIAVSVASGGIGAALGEGAAGLVMGSEGAEAATELSVGARIVGGTVRLASEAALNTAGQVEVQGGSYGEQFLENLIVTAGSMGVGAVMNRIGKELTFAKDLEGKTAGIWGKIGRGTKTVLKEGVAISLHTVTGAALGYVAHRMVERKARPQSMELRDWFLQGASITIGRHTHDLISGKAPLHRKLELFNELGAGDLGQLDTKLLRLSERAQQAPKPEDTIEILEQQHAVLEKETSALDTLAQDPVLQERAKVTDSELAKARSDNQTEHAAIQDSGLDTVAMQSAGVEELEPGVVSGTAEQLQHLEAAAKRMGLDIEVTLSPADKTYKVRIGKKTLKFHVREGGKAISVASLETHSSGRVEHELAEPHQTAHVTNSGFGHQPHAVDPHQGWLDDINSRLTHEEQRRLRLVTAGKSPSQVYAMFDGDANIARQRAQRSNLPNDLIGIRSSLSDKGRRAFDAKWEDMTFGSPAPSAGRVEGFRKFLKAMQSKADNDLNRGLETYAQPAAGRIVHAPEAEAYPKEWDAKFLAEENQSFVRRLEEFRGTTDLTPNGRGSEGTVYVRSDQTRALKRWFKAKMDKFSFAVAQLRKYKAAVSGNAELSRFVDVVEVYEVGADWIERDWSANSVEIKDAPASEHARLSAIESLKDATGEIELGLRKKLENKSANIHWSQTRGKIIVIDTQ